MKETIIFVLEKECKHSVRYAAESGSVDTIYVKKTGLPTPYPKTLTITVAS